MTKRKNPRDKNGKISRCAICESIYHWARNCPDKEPQSDVKKSRFQEDTALLGSSQTQERTEESLISYALNTGSTLWKECSGKAILDTACTGTVCGKRWFDDFYNQLDHQSREQVRRQHSSTHIVFGDLQERRQPLFEAVFPVTILGNKCTITATVLDGDLPLLLSKSSMSKAGIVIDLDRGEWTIFGQTIKPQTTKSGRYLVSLLDTKSPEQLVFYSAKFKLDRDILKLHKQFGHCSPDNLAKLLKSTNLTELQAITAMKISEVLGKCQVCDHQKKAPWKPVVSYPLANDFNELVCIDLHQLGPNLWYLHCICAFSRFSLAISVSSKDANVVISKYIKCWVSIFGPPSRAILSDNGGEFCNEKFQEFAESFNLEVKATGSHSPFSNGICERHNALLTDTLEKVTRDHPEIDLDTRLTYACMAKNSLSMFPVFLHTKLFWEEIQIFDLISLRALYLLVSNLRLHQFQSIWLLYKMQDLRFWRQTMMNELSELWGTMCVHQALLSIMVMLFFTSVRLMIGGMARLELLVLMERLFLCGMEAPCTASMKLIYCKMTPPRAWHSIPMITFVPRIDLTKLWRSQTFWSYPKLRLNQTITSSSFRQSLASKTPILKPKQVWVVRKKMNRQ